MKDINPRTKMEEAYNKYHARCLEIAAALLNVDFKKREREALEKNKKWYKKELRKIKDAHNRGRSSILQDEMIARRRMHLKEVQ